jgi:hypothetical protein
MIWASACPFVELPEIVKIQTVNDSGKDADRIIILNVFIYPTWKKDRLVGVCKDESVSLP